MIHASDTLSAFSGSSTASTVARVGRSKPGASPLVARWIASRSSEVSGQRYVHRSHGQPPCLVMMVITATLAYEQYHPRIAQVLKRPIVSGSNS